MKKKYSIIIIFLLITIAILCNKFIESQSQKRELQNSIDVQFKGQLSKVLGSFSVKVNDYTYREMISNVHTVAMMSNLTTFEEENDDLDISLYNLYISLREDKSKEKVLLRTKELYDIFFIMEKNPNSHEATDRLIQIANETFFFPEEENENA